MKNNQRRLFILPKIENKLINLNNYNTKKHVKYQLFLHNIVYQQSYKKLKSENYIPIQRNIMCKELGNDPSTYYHVRNLLLDNNIVEVYKKINKNGKLTETYAVGHKSKQYRIKEEFSDCITSKTITHNFFKKQNNKKYKKLLKELETNEHAKRMYFQFKKLKINETLALHHLKDKKRKLNLEDFSLLQREHQKYYIKQFNKTRERFFHWDNISERHYTNLTNMNKEYRQYLYFEDKNIKLVNLDIKNSQPVLFNLLIDKYIKDIKFNNKIEYNHINIKDEKLDIIKEALKNEILLKNKTIENIIKEFYKIYNIEKIIITYYTYVVVFENYEIKEIKELIKKEAQRFRIETETGVFYDNLFDCNEERKKHKINFFKDVFFSKYYKSYTTKTENIFIEKYPIIYSIINYYKLQDYKSLSIKLQRIESNLIIKTIAKRINEEYPHVLLATIHDSITCQCIYKDLVKTIMNEEFKKINLNPQIRIE